MTTFWNGHRAEDNMTVVQFIDRTENRKGALGDFLKFANLYYDINNNGCFHWTKFGPSYRALCKKYGTEMYDVYHIRHSVRNGYVLDDLEVLGNKIMDAALELIKE